jgi:hypothetical protein
MPKNYDVRGTFGAVVQRAITSPEATKRAVGIAVMMQSAGARFPASPGTC